MRQYSNYEIFNIILNTDISKLKAQYSIVNKNERTPSLFFYYNEHIGDWFFKDFSSGIHGGPIKYLSLKENISYEHAKEKLYTLLNTNKGTYINTEKQLPKTKTYEYDILRIEDIDLEYWSKYNITKADLIRHNVYPVVNLKINGYKYNNRWIGYLNNIGTLIQLYAPKNSIYNDTDKKSFITINNKEIHKYITNKNNLIITKSKKDIIVLEKIYGNKFSYVSWLGETTKIEKDVRFFILINKYKNKYINFDNDDVGIKRMNELKKYGLKPLIVNEYKDVSDYVMNNKQINNMFNINNLIEYERSK